MSRYDNLINGQWKAADGYSANTNPSDLSDVIGEYAQGNAADVEAAIAAAAAAFPAWSTSGIQARHDALDRIGNEILARKEELGDLLAREEGKTRPEAIGEQKSTRLNSSHLVISYAVFCLKKKNIHH